jgi:TetR/AcrR family transcriptional regulator
MPRTASSGEAIDSREAILRAALRSFAEKGYDGSSTREIATQAGVNQGLIPYYFGGKLKLWQAAVDLAFGELAAGLDAALADSDASSERDRTALLLRNYVRFVARNPEFVRLMHEEGKRQGPRMRWLVDRHVKPMYEAVKVLMGRSQARGVLPPDIDPIHFHYLLAGAVGLIFHQAEECKRLAGVDPFDDAVVEEHARVVEYLFLGPPNEEPSA